MHEVSLVRTIFRTLEEHFTPQELARIEAIELKVGPLANVEPVLLQNAFAAVQESESTAAYRQAQLRINLIPILVHCPHCDQTTQVEQYHFVCTCGRPCANVVQGNELLIERVTLRD